MPTVTTTYVIGNGSNGAGANQIVSETTSGVTTDYEYDGNGNRSSRTVGGETDTYTYDDENRLIELVEETGANPGTYTYAYDYRTRRVTRTEPGPVTTQSVFDGGLSIIEFTSSASSPTVEYIRGHDYGGGVGGLEYTMRDGVASFNFYDSRGDVTTKTDASGTVTYQTGYEAFGNQTVSNGTTPLDRQRASTKEQDPTGLLNEGFRYRDPSTGTFLTRDPLGFKAGPNMYTYVRQNPWTHFDPEGLDAFPTDVMQHVNAVGAHLTLPASNIIGRQAAMNLVGEENLSNHNKGLVMSAVHQMHNIGASTGLSALTRAFSPLVAVTNAIIPESWTKGNAAEKAMTQLAPRLHDVGPANIKTQTAEQAMGANTLAAKLSVDRSLVTDKGTAEVASRLVQNAQKELKPFISSRATQEQQVQIITDYLRAGPSYWQEAGTARHMTSQQTEQWHQHPDTFRMPDGTKPASLQPNKPPDKAQMKQIQTAEKTTRPSS
jgi:RHS repeat-associated protein